MVLQKQRDGAQIAAKHSAGYKVRAEKAEKENAVFKQLWNTLKERCEKAERELESYKKAKAENDERFMTERDEARSELAEAKADLSLNRKICSQHILRGEADRNNQLLAMTERQRDQWIEQCKKAEKERDLSLAREKAKDRIIKNYATHSLSCGVGPCNVCEALALQPGKTQENP